MTKLIYTLLVLLTYITLPAQPVTKIIALEKGEQWFGASVNAGKEMPFKSGDSINLVTNNYDNQTAPLLLSTKGRYVWSNEPFKFVIDSTALIITGDSLFAGKKGTSLRDAYLEASHQFFPPSGKAPDSALWQKPQYNTWIELIYNQNQQDILKYAHNIIDNGFPPGVLMIDDNWADYYGKFSFRKDRFPDAAQMITDLHQMGFKVMIWVSPFISPDAEEFRRLKAKKLLLMDNGNNPAISWQQAKDPAIINWWNGYSAELDLTNPGAIDWFKAQLSHMVTAYGVDGFKLDAGDMDFFPLNTISYKKESPNEQCKLWGQFGLLYPLNEYRAMWKRGGQPLGERLADKQHTWSDLQTLIPNITAAGLLGYPFACPDMIGGGNFVSFINKAQLDQDLIVRSAQVHALMPMMQFSVSPWRVLDQSHLDAVKAAVQLRLKYTPYINQLMKEAATTGEPVVRRLEYNFPNQGLSDIKDEFMLGNLYLVAPVVDQTKNRMVTFPKGKWADDNGKKIKGPVVKSVEVPINILLVYKKID